jgi:hypothetical protein
MRFNAMSVEGEALTAQGRFAEAEPLLLAGHNGLKDAPVLSPSRIGKDFKGLALERIVQLYDRWHAAESSAGYDRKASEWRAALEEWQASMQRATFPNSAKATEVDAAERAPPGPYP